MNEKRKKIIQYAMRIVLLIIISFTFGLTVYMWNAKKINNDLMPMPFKIAIGYVKTGSMQPNLNIDDLIIVVKTNDYEVDDIIVYQSCGELIVHRIVSINDKTIITKGDDVDSKDAPISYDQVKGEVVKSYPKIGTLAKLFSSSTSKIILLAAAIVLLVLSYRKEKENDDKEIEALKEEIRKLKENI